MHSSTTNTSLNDLCFCSCDMMVSVGWCVDGNLSSTIFYLDAEEEYGTELELNTLCTNSSTTGLYFNAWWNLVETTIRSKKYIVPVVVEVTPFTVPSTSVSSSAKLINSDRCFSVSVLQRKIKQIHKYLSFVSKQTFGPATSKTEQNNPTQHCVLFILIPNSHLLIQSFKIANPAL